MKFSNFQVLKTVPDSQFKDHIIDVFATVDVTSGILWWKKTETRRIRRIYQSFWHFIDTGTFTPGSEVEKLVRVYNANNGTRI